MALKLKSAETKMSTTDKIIKFCLDNKLITELFTIEIIVTGIIVAPFDWNFNFLPRSTVAVDAIPDIGENQQIVLQNGWADLHRMSKIRSPIL